jgi:hypothetical protein
MSEPGDGCPRRPHHPTRVSATLPGGSRELDSASGFGLASAAGELGDAGSADTPGPPAHGHVHCTCVERRAKTWRGVCLSRGPARAGA